MSRKYIIILLIFLLIRILMLSVLADNVLAKNESSSYNVAQASPKPQAPPAPPSPTGDITLPPAIGELDTTFDPEKNARIPSGEKMTKYYDDFLCIQVSHPKEWQPARSETHPEFLIKSPEIKGLRMLCRRIKIMKGRKFKEETEAILKYEFTGRKIKVTEKTLKPLGKSFHIMRVTSYDYFTDAKGKNKKIRDSIYVFVKAGEEVSMFFFETPSQYSKKTLPLFEKMIKTIKVVKRRDPGSTGQPK